MRYHTDLPPKSSKKVNWSEWEKYAKRMREKQEEFIGIWLDTQAEEFLDKVYDASFQGLPIEERLRLVADAVLAILVNLNKLAREDKNDG